jgi:hypothetical protein
MNSLDGAHRWICIQLRPKKTSTWTCMLDMWVLVQLTAQTILQLNLTLTTITLMRIQVTFTLVSTSTSCHHNVVWGKSTNCSFPWTGRTYTAWIDYNGSKKILEVWFANGSLTEGVMKPAGSGLIKVSKLDPIDSFDEY